MSVRILNLDLSSLNRPHRSQMRSVFVKRLSIQSNISYDHLTQITP